MLKNQTVPSNETSNKKTGFSVLKNVNDSLLLVDKIYSIFILRWKGRIDVATASETITLAGAAMTLNRYSNILIDRSSLIEFDSEARLWIDNWIKSKAKNTFVDVKKIAIINSVQTFGNIYNNAFNSTIAQVLPHITLNLFGYHNDAIKWLSK